MLDFYWMDLIHSLLADQDPWRHLSDYAPSQINTLSWASFFFFFFSQDSFENNQFFGAWG